MLRNIISKLLPNNSKHKLKTLYFRFQIYIIPVYHKQALRRARNKNKIKVVFFVFQDAVWKCDELYKLLLNDRRFEPIIVVCPFIKYGEETTKLHMNRAYEHFKSNNYNVIKSYNDETGNWLDVKNDIKPDVIFFTLSWDLTRNEYSINNFKKHLTCYVPYTFVISYLYEGYFNQPMHNYVWKFFVETTLHLNLSQKYALNKGFNAVHTGYPGLDKLLKNSYSTKHVWKIKDKSVKRIIWSPHHTIEGFGESLDFSTFLKYHDFMLQIAKKYSDKIQIAFKPHPLLKTKLSEKSVWGVEKTEKYYRQWEELTNGQLNEGEYIDLFATSDGLINDSTAFVTEYLFTQKPMIFLMNDDLVEERLNEVGKIALNHSYKGWGSDDIENFLENVIINGNDELYEGRLSFFNYLIKPPNNLTASENIYKCLTNQLFQS